MIAYSIPFLCWLFFGATVAGIFGALLGIGGGMFIVPIMVLGFHLPMKYAVAASIVSVIATSNAGGSSYVEKRIANIKLAMYLEIFTTFGAIAGAALALHLAEWLMLLVFALLTLYMGYGSFTTRNLDEQRIAAGSFNTPPTGTLAKKLDIHGAYYDQSLKQEVPYHVTGLGLGGIISVLAGLCSGLLGVGGGILKVSAMNRYMNVPMKVSVGTSKLMIGITAAVSSLVFFLAGTLHFSLVGPVALGTTLGANIGTSIMNRLRSRDLKLVFTVVVLYMSYSMIAKAIQLHWGIHLPSFGA
ncbi:sulfite exporter TauE/SafE family protein [Terriglobus tenax]|uniref:sulfite exporter TauE/SafE family protein n=1 Tax=Terriglobus tenax TaxID=1111115 RepID=UPI0021E01049|nr:sulfite exporter TauE/SafE family protein [Terriglobus tenax]